MYQGFYGLKDHPFRLTPDPSFICMTTQHQEALSGLVYSICTRPGLAVLVGEAGTGKTTLLYALTEFLEKGHYVVARCNNPTLTRAEFYDLLLAELGVTCTSPLKSRQLMALQQGLLEYSAGGRSAVLILDEAQRLPLELLEEVRLLLNLETPREKLLQIIMAGQPELADTLARAELRQLKQRVSAICRLQPLSLEELHEYVQHRLAQAGIPNQDLFPKDVIGLVHRYSSGIPRLVNNLCDSALQTGFALQSPKITVAILEEVAGDLELSGPPEKEPVPITKNDLPKVVSMPILNSEVHTPDILPATGSNGNRSTEERVTLATGTNGNGRTEELAPPATGSNKNGRKEDRVPLESYSSRQKSLGFLGGLVDRWRSG